MSNSNFRVIIVGAGPVGLYVANALQQANIEFVVLEQEKTVLKPAGQLLFVWPQTVRLFDQIGLLAPMQEAAFQLYQKKRTSGIDGRVTTTSNFWGFMRENHGYPFLLILRSDLVRILYANLKRRDTHVRTDTQVIDIVPHAHGIHVKAKDGAVVEGSIVIGSDGVHSETRSLMQRLAIQSTGVDEGNPMQSSFYGLFGRASIDQVKIEPGVLFESRGAGTVIQCSGTRRTLHFVTLTPLPSRVTERIRYNTEGMETYATSIADVAVCPGVTFREIWKHADKSTTVLVNQEEGFLSHWHHDRIVLVGDAVHKVTSVNGLGMTCGLHSAAALANELQSLSAAMPHDPTAMLFNQAFAKYQRIRESECRAIWAAGRSMVREVTRRSRVNWLWDTYFLPWLDMESFAKGILVSLLLIRYGHILTYIPFDEQGGRITWVRRCKR
ncbi:Uu.00g133660.m01.CDS01 [Anthostomella pinea]|uniref:Uu.00g133660.m01.CDS01 n=1 Tax=Anthostomella pinea TaxID=933095 RepID=A0AAI8YKQ4_9PEZI|nr:Uu.00g133660.m01.CDS01 [Anthostomella pinea]